MNAYTNVRQGPENEYDFVARTVWQLGGYQALAELLPQLPRPVICPACLGHGTVGNTDGGVVRERDGVRVWYSICKLCFNFQRVADYARFSMTGQPLIIANIDTRFSPYPITNNQHSPPRGYGRPLGDFESLDERVAERAEGAARGSKIDGAFQWDDPREFFFQVPPWQP